MFRSSSPFLQWKQEMVNGVMPSWPQIHQLLDPRKEGFSEASFPRFDLFQDFSSTFGHPISPTLGLFISTLVPVLTAGSRFWFYIWASVPSGMEVIFMEWVWHYKFSTLPMKSLFFYSSWAVQTIIIFFSPSVKINPCLGRAVLQPFKSVRVGD